MLDELSAVGVPKIVGVVLDVSHTKDRIAAAKKSLIDAFVRNWGRDDLVYITTDPDRDRLPLARGEGMARLADFTPHVNMNAAFLLKHTVQMVVQSDRPDKMVIYVTDRYKPGNNSQLVELFRVSEQKEYGIVFCVVAIGDKNVDELLKATSTSEYVYLYKTDDPSAVGTVIDRFALSVQEKNDGRSEEESTQDQAAEPQPVLEAEGGHPDPVPRGVREGGEAGGGDPVCGEEQPVPDHTD